MNINKLLRMGLKLITRRKKKIVHVIREGGKEGGCDGDAPSSTVERTWSKGRKGSSTPAFPQFNPNIIYLFVRSFSYLVWTPLPAFLALLSSFFLSFHARSWLVFGKIFCSDGIAGWAKASGCAVPLAALPRRWGWAGAHSEQRHRWGVSCWWAPLSSCFAGMELGHLPLEIVSVGFA